MKKLFIAATLLIGMVAGAMVLSSFSEPKEETDVLITENAFEDDGWEDYTTGIQSYGYHKRNGQWESTQGGASHCIVQRRAWCGSTEYRISPNNRQTWYAVSESPIDDYRYCYWAGTAVYCFNM